MTSETARIFNSAIGASAIAATFEFGLFEELKANGTVDLEEFCDRRDLTCWSVTSVLQVLHCFDIVAISPDRKTARRGSLFAETYQDKGYFLWLMRGYGNLLHNLATIVKNGDCTLEGIGRDGKYIAMAGRDYGARFVDPHFTEMLEEQPFVRRRGRSHPSGQTSACGARRTDRGRRARRGAAAGRSPETPLAWSCRTVAPPVLLATYSVPTCCIVPVSRFSPRGRTS